MEYQALCHWVLLYFIKQRLVKKIHVEYSKKMSQNERAQKIRLYEVWHFNYSVCFYDKWGCLVYCSNRLLEKSVLRGKKFTVGLTMEAIEKLGVFEIENYSEDLVVQGGNIITARGRGFIRFGIYLGNALNLKFDERWY